MPVLNRSADRFQRALEGERVTDARLAALLETSRHLVELGGSGPAPDAAFVSSLRERLAREAARLPAPTPASAKAAAERRAAARAPVVVVLGRGTPRLVAGAAASALLAAGVVGVASRDAVPGDALYPVKNWLGGVQVRLADNDLDRGRAHLAQAQEHISDARELSERRAGHEDVDVALGAAITSVQQGQRSLDAAYTATHNPQALIAMRDFTARALPQVDVLRGEVPSESLPLVGRLEALLRESHEAAARRIASCGAPCSELASTFGPSSLPSSLVTSSTSAPGATGSSSSTAPTRAPAPRTTTSAGGGIAGPSVAGPSVSADVGGLDAGVGGGGASAGTGGASLGLPTVSASVPVVPSATANLPLPSVTLGTGGAGATLPSQTLGPVTLPGATLQLP